MRIVKTRRNQPAPKQKEAKERLYSELGSKHRIKRHLVSIKDTKLIKDVEDINDPIVKSLTKGEVSTLRLI